jgi:hypothetical protein
LPANIPKVTTTVDFNLLEPALFTLRLIYDENKTVYDSGNYLERKTLCGRGDLLLKRNRCTGKLGCRTSFDVSIPYIPEPKRKRKNSKGFRVIVSF